MSGAADAARVTAALERHGAEVIPLTRTIMRSYGDLLLSRIIANGQGYGWESGGGANARGNPHYLDTIEVRESQEGDAQTIEVGTDHPAGWRLERGYIGQDRLGRHYNQAPRPHFGPAWDQTIPDLLAALRVGALTEEIAP